MNTGTQCPRHAPAMNVCAQPVYLFTETTFVFVWRTNWSHVHTALLNERCDVHTASIKHFSEWLCALCSAVSRSFVVETRGSFRGTFPEHRKTRSAGFGHRQVQVFVELVDSLVRYTSKKASFARFRDTPVQVPVERHRFPGVERAGNTRRAWRYRAVPYHRVDYPASLLSAQALSDSRCLENLSLCTELVPRASSQA